jgi:hypothetical protein
MQDRTATGSRGVPIATSNSAGARFGSTTMTTRSEGITAGEKYLRRLCEQTFLSLWSYANVHIDKGQIKGKGHCRELCDLLVVFENHIIIFPDKEGDFQDRGDVYKDWNRWFRESVVEAANEAWGAERRIRMHPDRMFLDRKCTEPFPIALPELATAKFHRVVVAHNASERCRREFGGTGSLIIDPDIIGDQHVASRDEGGSPFAIGHINPSKGYVHVLDDTSLDAVMRELDTITDFVNYLTAKETFILEGHLAWAAGEDDFLAFYLRPSDDVYEIGLTERAGDLQVVIPEGLWEQYEQSDFRRARREANEISYVIDRLIEHTAKQAYAGTHHSASNPGVQGAASILRFLARESRTRRRSLGKALTSLIDRTPSRNCRLGQVVHPSEPGDPYYVLLVLSYDPDKMPYEEYLAARKWFLESYCAVVKVDFPDAEDIVGIATESGPGTGRSEIFAHLDARVFTDAQRQEAERIKDKFHFLEALDFRSEIVLHYPAARADD